MFQYLVGVVILGLIWMFVLLFVNRHIRHAMLASGLLYAALIIPTFFLHKTLLFFFQISPLYNPGYGNPETLFNLSRITGGLAIEDALFMIFMGGLALFFFELVPGNLPRLKKADYSPILAFIVAYFLLVWTKINPIYLLILPSFAGALVLMFRQPSYMKGSFFTAVELTIFYFAAFIVVLLIFPNAVQQNYTHISNIFIWKVPIEELLYAFTFGMFWGPMYKAITGRTIIAEKQ